MAEQWQYRVKEWYDGKRGKRKARQLTFDKCPRCGDKKLIDSRVCRECWEKERLLRWDKYCEVCGKKLGKLSNQRFCGKECKRIGRKSVGAKEEKDGRTERAFASRVFDV